MALAAACGLLLLPAGSAVGGAASAPCGPTTLQATLVVRDGRLACGPGQALNVRTELAKANAARLQTRSPLLSFLTMAGMSIPDEESPLRTEFADSCGSSFEGSFRPQEALVPALVNASVQAADALASSPTGSPLLHAPYSFAVQLGDGADNEQYDEVRTFVDLLDGGKVVDPDTGKDGYEGTQATDPTGGTPGLASPVAGKSLRDLGNEAFYAPGLRTIGGAPLPWYSVIGARDVRAGGWAPADNAAWQTFANAFATGQLKLSALGSDRVEQVCDDPSVLSNPSFWSNVAASPGAATLVAADPDRRVLDRAGWVAEQSKTSGLPAGHGLGGAHCTDADGKALDRACYSWTQEPVQFIALDTTPASGTGTGDVDAAQWAWLQRTLIKNSSRYFDDQGDKKTAANHDRLIVVFSHHATSTLDKGAAPADGTHDGADLEQLLLRFPNVVLHVDSDAAHGGVVAHRDAVAKTSYWEINATSVSEWPVQSRSIELADNHDGTLSILGVLFDAAAPPDARAVRWSDDATNEKKLGADASVNERWLASAAREIALHDPQRPANVALKDRNVELVLKNPLGLTKPPVLNTPNLPTVPVPTFGNFGPSQFPQFPTGFPAGVPQNGLLGQIPGQQQQFNGVTPAPFFGGTQRGLAVKPTGSDGAYGTRVILLLLASAVGASWLVHARVRRWMIGI